MKLITKIKNYFFCLKYPFWKFYDWRTDTPDYSTTWYESIPEGWRKAFGVQLSKDIKKAGKDYRKKIGKYKKWSEMIKWNDIKEKWGELRLSSSCIDEIEKVIDKYELLSIGYCIDCGKPARYRTRGWVEYYCKDCFTSHRALYLRPEDLQKELEAYKLTKKDIPTVHRYHTTLSGKVIKRRVNLKKAYGIDFNDMWGLK